MNLQICTDPLGSLSHDIDSQMACGNLLRIEAAAIILNPQG